MKPYLCLFLLLVWPATESKAKKLLGPDRAEWMEKGGYGLSYDFNATKIGAHNIKTWNEAVERFDVEGFATQAMQAGAAWVIFTMGDSSGYWCAPNKRYDELAGHETSRCSNRDLPGELYTALAKHGIRLILRMPSRAPVDDRIAAANFQDRESSLPASQAFNAKWHSVIEEWAKRYNTGLAGWYFDGAYNWAGWEDNNQPYNFTSWAKSARSGNPNALLTFNSKKVEYFAKRQKKKPEVMDYMPGQLTHGFSREPFPNHWAIPPNTVWHTLIPLAGSWGQPGYSQLEPDLLAIWVNQLINSGGTVTLDVGIWSIDDRYGYIPPWQIEALQRVRGLVRTTEALPPEQPAGMEDLSTNARLIISSGTSRYHQQKLEAQIFTTGAASSGNAFITRDTANPFVIISLAKPAIVHRIEIFRAPRIDWDPTKLEVSIWNTKAGAYNASSAVRPESWVKVWQAQQAGWKWVLNIPDGIELERFKIGLQSPPVSFNLGRIKIYGSEPDYDTADLPDDWAQRQEILREQKEKKQAEKKGRGFSWNPFR